MGANKNVGRVESKRMSAWMHEQLPKLRETYINMFGTGRLPLKVLWLSIGWHGCRQGLYHAYQGMHNVLDKRASHPKTHLNYWKTAFKISTTTLYCALVS